MLNEDSQEDGFLENPLVGPPGAVLSKATMFHDVKVQTVFAEAQVEILENNLKTWYDKKMDTLECVQNVEVNGFYAAYVPAVPAKPWFRCYVINFVVGNKVHVLLIDHGQEIAIDPNNIFPLRTSFCELSAAAIPATLQVMQPHYWNQFEIDIFKADTEGNEFRAVILGRFFNNAVVPFEILRIVLIKHKEKRDHVYTFRGRYKFCYGFGISLDKLQKSNPD